MREAQMKKAFPVLWKYLLVVVTSCALAFFISQNTARAAQASENKIDTPISAAVSEHFGSKQQAQSGVLLCTKNKLR
jgi:hypothetical protein